MRLIDLTPYKVGEKAEDGTESTFDVRGSLVICLFSAPHMPPQELLKCAKLAELIEGWPDNRLVVEGEDYNRLVQGLEHNAPSGRVFIEFVRRVLEAPEVKVKADDDNPISS